jgi:DNA-binding CsgD family transcriptional regulator/transcriptional regulator with XRE-family HTH domain
MADRVLPRDDPRAKVRTGTVNGALRAARRAAGLSLDVLAARTNFSKSYLANIESGRRRVTAEIAAAYDNAVGTGGLLARMLADEPDRLVGRAGEVALLRRLVVEVLAGRGRAAWLEGEPGIGKSALLAAGLAGAQAGGCRVLWAAADESLARFPLWVLLESVRGDPDPQWAQITALLRGTSTPMSGDAVLAAAERFVLVLEHWCAAGPVVLAIDDLQWSDEVSLSVWGRLRRLVAQVPLLLIGSCRPVPQRAEVAALRRGVVDPDGVLLTLEPLGSGQVTELTGWFVGAPAGPRLRTAVDQAGGNPLYLREMVEALVREERIRLGDGIAELVGPAVPPSLADAIGARLGFLSEQTRSVLRIAALLGPEPTVADLSVVAGRPAVELAGVVDEAVAAGVLVASDGRMAFRHGLIRSALYEQTPPALRVALHRQAARALAEAGGSVEVVAEQLLAGGAATAGIDAWVVDWLVDGAAVALVNRAPQAALELIDAVPYEGRTAVAGYRIAALSRLGRDEEVVRCGPGVLAEASDTETIGRTAWTVAYSLGRLGEIEQGRAVIAGALARGGLNRVWQARLAACDGMLSADRATALRALAESEAVADPVATGYALHGLTLSYHYQDPDEETALGYIDRALAVIGERPETADLRALLLANRMVSMVNLGRPGELPQAIGAALAAAERVGTTPRLATTRIIAADLYYHLGRWDDALAEIAGSVEHAGSHRLLVLRAHAVGAHIALHREDQAALGAHLDALAGPDADGYQGAEYADQLRLAGAFAIEAAGRPAEALDAVLDAGLTKYTALAHPYWHTEVPEIVRLALACGRRAEAAEFTRMATGWAQADPQPGYIARVQQCQGLLDADPELAAAAVHGYERVGLVLYRAQALETQAVLLAGRGDLDGAQRAYDAAADGYLNLEASWDLRRAESRLRPYGLRRSRYRVRRRPETGWEALTPSERAVAELVADGLSNPVIAGRLHISRRTVETHVAHLLAKLRARSRAEVARAVESERR